jgi:tight adherence protein B
MDGTIAFIGMVFAAAFLLAQGLIVPVFGENRQVRKRLQQRLADIDRGSDLSGITSLLRQRYLEELSPVEAMLESLPFMEALRSTIEQAGHRYRAYRVLLLAILLGVAAGVVCWTFTRILPAAMAVAVIVFALPFLKIRIDRAQRFARFDEQLPDAIDVMRRALMAGHPFGAALGLVADDMDDPIATELRITFSDVNYGNDARRAMLGLLSRVPSVSVMALVTSVLVQRETGGNLAEILKQIAGVIRGRFRFQRRVKTLSAEGRLSAWILAMVPLGLFLAMSIMTPDYFPILLESPLGRQVVAATFFWACIGVFFIRRIIRIDV